MRGDLRPSVFCVHVHCQSQYARILHRACAAAAACTAQAATMGSTRPKEPPKARQDRSVYQACPSRCVCPFVLQHAESPFARALNPDRSSHARTDARARARTAHARTHALIHARMHARTRTRAHTRTAPLRPRRSLAQQTGTFPHQTPPLPHLRPPSPLPAPPGPALAPENGRA